MHSNRGQRELFSASLGLLYLKACQAVSTSDYPDRHAHPLSVGHLPFARVALAFLLSVALGACSTPGGRTAANASGQGAKPAAAAAGSGSSNASVPDLPLVNLDSATLFQLMAADIAAQRGQPATAYATYMSLAIKTADPRLARRALEVALREQNTDSALESARLWNRLAPKDAQANQSLTVLLVSRGLIDEARPRLAERFKADRTAWFAAKKAGAELPEDTPWEQAQRSIIRAPNKFEAYQLLVDLFADDAKETGALRVLAAQAHFAGAHQMAVEHARALLKAEPSSVHALLLAQYQQSLPDGGQQSLQTLESFLTKNPGNTDVAGALARLYTLDQQWDKARALFEPLLLKEPDNTEILYVLTGLAIQQNDRAGARRFLQQYMNKTADGDERDLTAVLLSLAQMAEEDKDLPDAIVWLDKVRNPVADATVRTRKAQILAKQGHVEDALKLLKKPEGTASDNDKLQIILTQAQILREAERLAPAASLLANALTEMPDQPDLLYEDAMLAEKQQQMERVERNLRKVIALRPDNPHAYNALGYSFADRNIRLDEARTLIDRATELAPNDAYIMDSLGWVLFRQGQTKEALKVLRKAYSIKADPEIAIHLGEVLWTTGDTDEARKLLSTVKDNAGTAQILRDALSRLGISGL